MRPASTIKRATGSTAEVDHALILAHIMETREAVITRAEKNLVAMAVYHMALTNPNPAWWKIDSPPMKGVVDERQERYNPDTRQMEPNPNFGQVVMRVDPTYTRADNVLMLKVNGQDRAVMFNEKNARAVRLAQALKNLDTADLVFIQKTIGRATRFLSAMNTKYNPIFAIVNALRDWQGAAINLTSTELNGKQVEIVLAHPAGAAKHVREAGDVFLHALHAQVNVSPAFRGLFPK
jgi:hypothetical protein